MVEHSPKILASVEKVTTTTIIQACAKKAKGKEKSDASQRHTILEILILARIMMLKWAVIPHLNNWPKSGRLTV